MNERQNISNVFLTTGDHFHLDDMPGSISDRGKLFATRDALVFSGNAVDLKIKGVQSIALSQVNPRRARVILASAAILLLGAVVSLVWGPWPLALVCSFFMLLALVQWRQKWVLVEYLAPDDQLNQVYFYDSSYMGLGGLLGGTRRIYQALQKQHKVQLLRGGEH